MNIPTNLVKPNHPRISVAPMMDWTKINLNINTNNNLINF